MQDKNQKKRKIGNYFFFFWCIQSILKYEERTNTYLLIILRLLYFAKQLVANYEEKTMQYAVSEEQKYKKKKSFSMMHYQKLELAIKSIQYMYIIIFICQKKCLMNYWSLLQLQYPYSRLQTTKKKQAICKK
eukprot:TRINITY_DN62983_c0_g1_i1.p2 TRINITY_DN62983_c0_g1~~TRINITY_DN62983_c0_g1_i1.p2  ORF type:complete len:140 (+),score=4.27 TRINITY_DN62983_c0_g1_i1:27-422(+)